MTFAYTTNTTPSTGPVAMWSFVALLKTQGWVVKADSDGTTYASGGGQVTGGGTGAHGLGNNDAWVRVQSPAGASSVEWIVQRISSDTSWRIKKSISAGFTGGSPSATQVPSATDETIPWGAGTDASPTGSAFYGTNGGYRFSCGADAASPYGFYSFAFPTGGGACSHGWVFDPLTNLAPTDGGKYAIHMSASPFTTAALQGETYTAGSSLLIATFPKVSPTGTDWNAFPSVTYVGSSNSAVVPNALPVNPISGADEAFPLILMRRAAIGTPGYKGICSLLKWTGILRTVGDTLTITTTRDRIVLGVVSLPWDGSVPTI